MEKVRRCERVRCGWSILVQYVVGSDELVVARVGKTHLSWLRRARPERAMLWLLGVAHVFVIRGKLSCRLMFSWRVEPLLGFSGALDVFCRSGAGDGGSALLLSRGMIQEKCGGWWWLVYTLPSMMMMRRSSFLLVRDRHVRAGIPWPTWGVERSRPRSIPGELFAKVLHTIRWYQYFAVVVTALQCSMLATLRQLTLQSVGWEACTKFESAQASVRDDHAGTKTRRPLVKASCRDTLMSERCNWPLLPLHAGHKLQG